MADKLSNPDELLSYILDPGNLNPHSVIPGPYWEELSLASGYPSILLFFSTLDKIFPEENWDEISHKYVLKIKDILEKRLREGNAFQASPSLFSGLSGICFSLQHASKGYTRYSRLIHTLNSFLVDQTERFYLSPLMKKIENKEPYPTALFDLIQGIIGVGLYELQMVDSGLFSEQIQKILEVLVSMTFFLHIRNYSVVGWFTPADFQFTEKDRMQFSNGIFNLGLAHGISGVLAFLSLATLRGIVVDGQLDAIKRITLWVKSKRVKLEGSFLWQNWISFEEEVGEITSNTCLSRDAWCYGTAGVARSLFLAGKALKDKETQDFSLESFSSIFKRSEESWYLPGPTFCHGISGLLMITFMMAQDTQDLCLKEKVHLLQNRLMSFYRPESFFGFNDAALSSKGGYIEISKAGLLDGATGVLLSLLSSCGGCSSWAIPFLIAETSK